MPFTTTQLPTDPTSDELAERDKLCHSLKIAFPILGIITAVILGVGIYLAADPGKHNYGLMILGYVLIALAIVFLIASIVTGNLLFRLIRAISETKVYHPKDAEALRDKPYPRQLTDTVRRRRAPPRTTAPQTRIQPGINPEEQRRDASASRDAPRAERVMEPRPVPSAPPPAVIGDNTHTNGANDDDECVKTFPPAPDLERPPPFAPPPDLPPPPYEELPSL